MGEIVKERLLGAFVFWVCLCTSLVLMVIGFLLPPMGEISPSVLQAVGWLFGFAALAKGSDTIITAIKSGYDAKVKHGETSIEIHND